MPRHSKIYRLLHWLLMHACPSFLRCFLARKTREVKRLCAIAARVQKKESITVAFMVLDVPSWRCDSVFRMMLQHPRFNPVIWIVHANHITDNDEISRRLDIIRSFFQKRKYPIAELFSLERMRAEYAPDVVFLAKPIPKIDEWDVLSMDRELLCYVPYCYQNTKKEDFITGMECHLWRNFYTTPSIRKLASSVMTNGGCNVVAVGSPVADNYFSDEAEDSASVWRSCGEGMKRIIWAPHWSVGKVSWFNVATFLDVAEDMVRLAEKYASRVQWAFKPHPLLRVTLYNRPDWGKEKTDAYYERWANMPNCQLEIGAYVDLFKQSDAMVHDSGSFIMEYLLVNKPCMYLRKQDGYNDFNDDTLKALDCYHRGSTAQDVEKFIQSLLRGEKDSMKEKRTRFREEYLLPPGGSCAQPIIDEILNGK